VLTTVRTKSAKQARRRVLPELPGETMVTITINGNDPLFPALVDTDELWNGAGIPRFRREVAGYVVDWVKETYAEYPGGSARAYWKGRTGVHDGVQHAVRDVGKGAARRLRR
jgi:hypothetical protein